jgi:hypothetical protein
MCGYWCMARSSQVAERLPPGRQNANPVGSDWSYDAVVVGLGADDRGCLDPCQRVILAAGPTPFVWPPDCRPQGAWTESEFLRLGSAVPQ